jgi:hypothetical protein
MAHNFNCNYGYGYKIMRVCGYVASPISRGELSGGEIGLRALLACDKITESLLALL